MKPLSTYLFEIQEKRNLSDKDMGKLLGMGRTHYCSLRTGTRLVGTLHTAQALYKLKVPAKLLLTMPCSAPRQRKVKKLDAILKDLVT